MSEITVAAVLEEAQNLLPDPEHWLKDTLVQNGDCFCIRGALFAAGAKLRGQVYERGLGRNVTDWLWRVYDETPVIQQADEFLTKRARSRYGSRLSDWGNVVDFNNHRETTFDDIRDLLTDAIEEARNPREAKADA